MAVVVTFKPLATGAKTASIIFASNTATGADTVSATGTGVQAGLAFMPSLLDMGSVTIGASKTDSIWVKNPGTSPLYIFTISSSDTTFKILPLLDTLAVLDSVRFKITFKAISLGAKIDTMVFASNNAHGKDTLIVSAQTIPSGVKYSLALPPRTFDLSVKRQASAGASTRIGFAVPEVAFVTIRVYDALGRDIITLVHKMLQPGKYGIVWDAPGSGTHISSGVYFYRMEARKPDGASAFVNTRRMVQ
jgi:hypothetical protein